MFRNQLRTWQEGRRMAQQMRQAIPAVYRVLGRERSPLAFPVIPMAVKDMPERMRAAIFRRTGHTFLIKNGS